MAEKQLEQNFSHLQTLIQERQQLESSHTAPESPDVKNKTDINYADVHGNTLLHYAAALGNLKKVQEYCAQKEINIHYENLEHCTPLMLALKNGHVYVAQHLLTMAKGQLKQNFSKLQQLISERQQFESSYTDPASPYVKYKTDINYPDIHGNTLLHYAAALGDLAKVHEYCAQRKINIHLENIDNCTPLELALQNGHIDVAQHLYTQGAKCNGLKLYIFQNQKSQEWLLSKMQDTVTKYAELFRSMKVSKIIKLKKSFYKDNNFFNSFNPNKKKQPFTRLLNLAIQVNDITVVQDITLKWQEWANDNLIALPNEKQDHTPAEIANFFSEQLIIAAEMGHEELCTFFISKGAEVNLKKSQYSDTPLFAAVRSEQISMVHYFLEKGANPNCQSSRKQTPLMLAIAQKNMDIVKELLTAGADIAPKDTDGNTAFHYAAKCAAPQILKLFLILMQEKFKNFVNTQNIYGHTPLDIAVQYKNDQAIMLIAPNSTLQNMQKLEHYGQIPIVIEQNAVLKPMRYFFRSQYRSTNFFPDDGHCNGFEGMRNVYSARGMTPYYYKTLELMVSWDGSSNTLNQKFSSHVPQAKYHENFYKLFEQWTNDVIWFQHDGAVRKIAHLGQDNRAMQYKLISFYPTHKSEYDYVLLHHMEKQKEVNEQQLMELFAYLVRMPSGVRIRFAGDKHVISIYIQGQNTYIYDDANCDHQTAPASSLTQLLECIIDYKYIMLEEYTGKFNPSIYMFCFKQDLPQLNLETFKIFQDSELPTSKEEAAAFQQQSPNKLTHLHIAIMTQSVPCVKKLLEDGYCDLNAVDYYGRSIFKLALESNNKDIIELFLQRIHLITDKTTINDDIVRLYTSGEHDSVDVIVKYLDASCLSDLFFSAIKKDDVQLVKFLVTTKGISIDYYDNSRGQLPLTCAMENHATDVMDFLLHNKASLTKDAGSRVSALALCIKRLDLYYKKIIANDPLAINEFDRNGDTAIHIALKHGNLEIFKDLLDRGADISLKSPQHYTDSALQILYRYARCPDRMPKPMPIEQFKLAVLDKLDLAKINHRQILFTMLLDEMQESDETFFKQLVAKCHGNTLMLEGEGLTDTYGGLLYRAYFATQVSKFALLLQAGCNPDHMTSPKTSLLVLNILSLKSPDASATWREKNYKMIELLLDHHADVTLCDRNPYSKDKGKNALDLVNESQDDRLQQMFASRGLLNAPSPGM